MGLKLGVSVFEASQIGTNLSIAIGFYRILRCLFSTMNLGDELLCDKF